MKSKKAFEERQEKLAKIFKKAIKMEQKAQRTYQKAIANCDDRDLKQILAGLRGDEARHEKELTSLFEDMKLIMRLQESASRKPRVKRAAKRPARPAKKRAT
jgi:rubrerythrin